MKVRMSQFLQTKRSLIVRVSIVFLLPAFVVTLCYFISLILGSIEIFQALFQKLGLAVGGQALACALCKLGLPSGLSFAIGRFARVLITGEQVSEMVSPLRMMPTGSDSGNSSPGWTSLLGSTGQQPSVAPSGGSHSGGWTELFLDVPEPSGSGSTNSSVNQPPQPEAVSPGAPVQGPLAPQPAPVIPQLQQPLLSDEVRSGVLYSRYGLLNFGRDDGFGRMSSIISNQLMIERSIEAALVDDGFHPQSIIRQYSSIRGILHSPRGELLSEHTYCAYVSQIREQGTRESVPYQRLRQAIRSSHLLLERTDGRWV